MTIKAIMKNHETKLTIVYFCQVKQAAFIFSLSKMIGNNLIVLGNTIILAKCKEYLISKSARVPLHSLLDSFNMKWHWHQFNAGAT